MQTALITGASRGIGKAIAEKLLSENYKVIGTSTSGNSDIQHENFEAIKLNLLDRESLKQAAKNIDGKIDILINNAGFKGESKSIINNIDDARNVLEINLLGLIEFTSLVLDQVNPGGSILNISSQLGTIESIKGYNLGAYNISKYALNAYSMSLAMYLQEKDIKVASVDPGWVQTDMGGQGADRKPEESAEDIWQMISKGFDTGSFYYKNKKQSW